MAQNEKSPQFGATTTITEDESLRAPIIPKEMRALVLDGTGFSHLGVRRVPTPCPGPQQMLARVDAAGICTSLIKLIEQGPNHPLLSGWDITRFPLILGDEGSVTLVEVGADLRARLSPRAALCHPTRRGQCSHQPSRTLPRQRARSEQSGGGLHFGRAFGRIRPDQ